MRQIKEPEKMIEWIRKNWFSLKEKGHLGEALGRWVKKGGYEGALPVDDIIFIEEQFPEYLGMIKMIQLSYSSLSLLHDRPHCWLNKQMKIPQPERPEWAIGKKIHKIIQDHVSDKKLHPHLKHIKYKFPVVEEVEFDERCRFEFDLNEILLKFDFGPATIKGKYKIIGFRDGTNWARARFLEIKSSDPIWSLARFKKSVQRKIYALEERFEEAILITCSKVIESWEAQPAKIYLVPLTQQDRFDAIEWILGGIKVLESGKFTTDLVDGKCVDRWCYWGVNCQFK